MKAKSKGYVIFDSTWSRLVKFDGGCKEDGACLWEAAPRLSRGPTLFSTKVEAEKAIKATRKWTNYAWSTNNYVIYEVS